MPSNPVPTVNKEEFDSSYYEPETVSIKKNSLGNPQTFNLIVKNDNDSNDHSFIQTTPLVCDRITLKADVNNSGTVLIGPQGNVNYPLAKGEVLPISKVDINVIYYNTQSGNKVYMLYSGAPNISSLTVEEERPATPAEIQFTEEQ